MIKYLKYIFAYLFASYFLLVGAGYNVVNYCCQTCADKGIEALETSSCFVVHHANQNTQQDDLTCNDLKHHSGNCHLLRLNTDTPSNQTVSLIDIKQIQPINLFTYFATFLSDKTVFFTQKNIPPPDIVVNKTGRLIITLHALLLI